MAIPAIFPTTISDHVIKLLVLLIMKLKISVACVCSYSSLVSYLYNFKVQLTVVKILEKILFHKYKIVLV